jgi:excisionase family DNA binding protein
MPSNGPSDLESSILASRVLLRPSDVARKLSVSRAWVYEAARMGRIPSVRLGGEDGPLRFIAADIDTWLAEARAGWATTITWSARRAAAGRKRARAACVRGSHSPPRCRPRGRASQRSQ